MNFRGETLKKSSIGAMERGFEWRLLTMSELIPVRPPLLVRLVEQ